MMFVDAGGDGALPTERPIATSRPPAALRVVASEASGGRAAYGTH